MFTVNYQTSSVKAKKFNERGFRSSSARKNLRKRTAADLKH
ncbi:Uncharacterised protein [Serratia marcescens]|nr:hypothetical protein SMKC041_47020 [Serratia marcescens]CVG44830.1 Uncharacterised protein [Serratia marcescens]